MAKFRVPLAISIVGIALLSATAAYAGHGGNPYAKGSGFGAAFEQFSFSARQQNNNQDHGTMVLRLPTGATIHAEVDCLSVSGNRATMSGDITRTEGIALQPGQNGLMFIAVDNTIGDQQVTPDQWSWAFTATPDSCFTSSSPAPIQDGDIVVDEG